MSDALETPTRDDEMLQGRPLFMPAVLLLALPLRAWGLHTQSFTMDEMTELPSRGRPLARATAREGAFLSQTRLAMLLYWSACLVAPRAAFERLWTAFQARQTGFRAETR